MYGAKITAETKRTGVIYPVRTSVISIECCVTSQCIELMFDQHSQQTGFFEWNKCFKESEEILDSKINRLSHAQLTLLNDANRQYYRRANTPHFERKNSQTGRKIGRKQLCKLKIKFNILLMEILNYANSKNCFSARSVSRSWGNLDESIPTTPTSIKFNFNQSDSDCESDSSFPLFKI